MHHIPRTKRTWARASALALTVTCLTASGIAQRTQSQVQGQQVAVADRWEPAIQKFEEQDRQNPPASNGIVFVGSSSIVRWNLAESFPELKALNRGFGGSLLADSVRYADRIVIPYRPRLVVLYAGDNDIGGGDTPEHVADLYVQFVTNVQKALPETKIVFVAIKPSILRWSLVDKMRSANAIIRAYVAKHERLAFVDVDPLMIGADGKPRPELFVQDGLHMTPEGYKVWTAALRPHLK